MSNVILVLPCKKNCTNPTSSNQKKLIFAINSLINIWLLQMKEYIINNYVMKFFDYFNQDIKQYCGIMKNKRVIIFGDDFNQLIILTPHIVKIYFGSCFNLPIVLTPRIVMLSFGTDFNRSIILTPRIAYLQFGYYFNQPIILTKKITHLLLGYNFNHSIILTPRITHIELSFRFNHPIILTKKITHMIVGFDFRHKIIFTQNIAHLLINNNWHETIDDLTNDVNYIFIGYNSELSLCNVPNGIKKIAVFHKYRNRHPKQCNTKQYCDNHSNFFDNMFNFTIQIC